MKLMTPAYVVLGTNVIAIIVVTTTVVIPAANIAARGHIQTISTHSNLTTTSTESSMTTYVTSSASSRTESTVSSASTSPGGGTATFTGSTTESSTTATSTNSTTATSTSTASARVASTTTSTTSTTTSTTDTTSESTTASSTTSETQSGSTVTTTTTTTTTATTNGCEVIWSLPEGTYQVGATISGTVTAGCEGEAKWQINGGTSHNVHCTPGTTETLFTVNAGSSSYPPGTYTVAVSFDNGHGIRSSDSSSFTITPSGQLPSVVFFATPASMVVVALLIRRKEKRDGAPIGG